MCLVTEARQDARLEKLYEQAVLTEVALLAGTVRV